jgi:4-amino-4-deoxy-L-arabinose transferase-like glycosyltransferase
MGAIITPARIAAVRLRTIASIASSEISPRETASRMKGLAALGALLLGLAGQLALETSGAHSATALFFAVVAFAAAAGLAIAALRGGDFLPGPPRPLELPPFPPGLYAACLPGAACLGAAFFVHRRAASGDAGAAKLWLVGLALLLLPGMWDWLRRGRPKSAGEKSERRRFAATALLLFAFSFGIRVWGGIDRIPGWLDSDEAAAGLDGRAALASGLPGLLGYWDMGSPRLTLFVSQAAAAPFGHGLRALRLGSALLGSLAVVFLFDFGRRLVGSRAALLAGLILSVNHVFLHWSRFGGIFIQTPFFASLVLVLLLRAMTGGSFLAFSGAAVALAVGSATYIATEFLPAVILLTVVGWAMLFHWPARRAVPALVFLAGVLFLVWGPIAATIHRITPEIAFQRIPAVSVLRPDGIGQLQKSYGSQSPGAAVAMHAIRTLVVFNFGTDHFKAYGANRPMADPVTAALVPVAAAVLLWRLSSPIGWVSALFAGAYLTGGVLFSASQPTYHRISVVLLFSSLGVAWVLVALTRVMAGSGLLSRGAAAALAVAVVAASAWLNLHFYFRESAVSSEIEARFGVGRLICASARGRTVLDATALAGPEYGLRENQYPELECPELRRVRIDNVEALRSFAGRSNVPQAVLLVPAAIDSNASVVPPGYRVLRRTVDLSIRRPKALALSVLELERAE